MIQILSCGFSSVVSCELRIVSWYPTRVFPTMPLVYKLTFFSFFGEEKCFLINVKVR